MLKNQKYKVQQPTLDTEFALNEFWAKSTFSIWHVNNRGLISHCAALVARLQLTKSKPTLICLNETFLDDAIENIDIEGYTLVCRRDRIYGKVERRCGGVAVYGSAKVADSMTLIHKSVIHGDT